VQKISASFLKGQQTGALLDGFGANLPEPMKGLLDSALGRLSGMLETAPKPEADTPKPEAPSAPAEDEKG
jgi:hypothetical protein